MMRILKMSRSLCAASKNINKAYICSATGLKYFSDDSKNKTNTDNLVEANSSIKNPVLNLKYETFTDENATIILDVEEEREKLFLGQIANQEEIEESGVDSFHGLNLERGVRGVFDIQDLVDVLRRDNAIDICVCEVPSVLKYVDYICIVTARSPRHMTAISEFVRKIFKMKRSKKDLIPRIEGSGSQEWIAMDMGNIALHIFSAEVRQQYDIEMLWSVGKEYDAESNKPVDPLVAMYERHSKFLSDLTPANPEDINKLNKT